MGLIQTESISKPIRPPFVTPIAPSNEDENDLFLGGSRSAAEPKSMRTSDCKVGFQKSSYRVEFDCTNNLTQ